MASLELPVCREQYLPSTDVSRRSFTHKDTRRFYDETLMNKCFLGCVYPNKRISVSS